MDYDAPTRLNERLQQAIAEKFTEDEVHIPLYLLVTTIDTAAYALQNHPDQLVKIFKACKDALMFPEEFENQVVQGLLSSDFDSAAEIADGLRYLRKLYEKNRAYLSNMFAGSTEIEAIFANTDKTTRYLEFLKKCLVEELQPIISG